jgi:hypothetical protein
MDLHSRTLPTSLSFLTYFHHLPEFLQVASDQIDEGEFVKILGSLICHLNHLMVPLQQGDFPELIPAVLVIKGTRRIKGNLRNKSFNY